MFQNIILRDTTKEEWSEIRSKIKSRVESTMGAYPDNSDISNHVEITGQCESNGLVYVDFKYHVIDGLWNNGICVLPEGFSKEKEYAPILAVHETNIDLGKKQIVTEPDGYDGAYGYDLARKGYVIIAVDQYGFGDSEGGSNPSQPGFEYLEARLNAFIEKYPNWSIDGLRLLQHKKAMDAALSFDFVTLKNTFGTIGNSQGGRGALFITAFDERVTCAVISAGVSPNATNAYRIVKHDRPLNPQLSKSMTGNGRNQWEYEEFIALCAPRAVLFIEPLYDDYNPHTIATISCIYSAFAVYKMLGTPEKIALYAHGDGHTTINPVKDFAYDWLSRFLV